MSHVASNNKIVQALTKNVVHAWQADLDEVAHTEIAFHLSPEEQTRARNFKNPLHQTRYSTGRNILRTLLGHYVDQEPGTLEFHYGSRGKPSLSPTVEFELHFNVSHCEEQMLIGLSKSAPIGVDIEKLRTLPDELALVQRFFEAEEIAEYLQLPDSLRSRGFFNAWTRKEAVFKARGDGLHLALDAIRVSLDPRRDCCIHDFTGLEERKEHWTLRQIEIADNNISAIASPAPIDLICVGTINADQLRNLQSLTHNPTHAL